MSAAKTDPFARAKSMAVVKAKAKAKDETMQRLVVPDVLKRKFVDLCELGYISKQLSKVLDSHKAEIGEALASLWAHEMWETRKKPDNYRAVSFSEGNPIIPECGCNFLLKFRKEGIKDQVPTAEKIPEGQTFEEATMTILRKIGLSELNAKRFVQEEIEVTEAFGNRSYDELNACEDGTPEKSAVTKMFLYMQCRSQAAKAKLPLFTDEEEQACLMIEQTITLKEGCADRIFTYCDSEEQLFALLKWIKAVREFSNFLVGEGEEGRITQWRLAKTMVRFLFGEEWTPEMVTSFLFGKEWTADLANKLVLAAGEKK